MKYLYLLLFSLIFTQTINAQSFVKSFPESFNSNVTHATALNNGTVILVIPNSGESTNYLTINSFKAIDSNGSVIWENNLSIEGNYPGSFYHIMKMKATPDGGWIVSGGVFDCDYYSSGFAVKFNADFEEEWIVKSSEILPNDYIGEFNRIQNIDDKIYLYSSNGIVTLDYSGNLLNHIDMSSSDYSTYTVINETQIYAYSNSLGTRILTYPEGILTNDDWPLSLPNEFSKIEILTEEENILAFYDLENGVKFFKDSNEIFNIDPNQNFLDLILFENMGNEIVIVIDFDGYFNLASFNVADENITTLGEIVFPHDFAVSAFTAVGNQIFAVGKEKYGLNYNKRQNVAIVCSQVFVSSTSETVQPTLDLALTNVTIAEPVQTYVFEFFAGEGLQYDFTDIEVTVTNNSSEPVNSFAINTSFETSTPNFFCDSNLSYTQHIEDASLAPGESTTIFIDSLTTYMISDTATYQLCFWVTHPDNEFDNASGNDIFCNDFNTSTENTSLIHNPFKIFPNPTSDYIYLENISHFEKYTIFTFEGKKIKTGDLNEGQQIDIKNLAKGIYFLHVSSDKGSSNFKFVKL